jgi:hypothetical protein
MGETLTPVRPNVRYSIKISFQIAIAGIVSSGLEMTGDRFTLFRRLCFKRSAKGPKSGLGAERLFMFTWACTPLKKCKVAISAI